MKKKAKTVKKRKPRKLSLQERCDKWQRQTNYKGTSLLIRDLSSAIKRLESNISALEKKIEHIKETNAKERDARLLDKRRDLEQIRMNETLREKNAELTIMLRNLIKEMAEDEQA